MSKNTIQLNKSFLAVLLSIVLLVSAVSSFRVSASLLGDADGDGSVTVSDARAVLRVAVGLDVPAERSVMDVDGDSEITVEDARLILRYSVGLERTFPAEGPAEEKPIAAAPNAACALLYDAASDRILFTKDSKKQRAPASLVKLLTAITALKHCPAESVFLVGSEIEMIGDRSSVCDLQKGWLASLKTLIAGMLTASGNDAAYCIAVNVARRSNPFLTNQNAVKRFTEMMTQTAAALGMRNSRILTPDGYDKTGQYSTAEDLLLLAKAALGNSTIREICGKNRVDARLVGGKNLTWYSTNKMLNPKKSFYHPEVTGLKTGSTAAAGNCIIVSFVHAGKEMIAVVLGAPTDADRYKAVEALMAALP